MPKAEAGVRDAGEHHGEVGIVYRQVHPYTESPLLLQRNPFFGTGRFILSESPLQVPGASRDISDEVSV